MRSEQEMYGIILDTATNDDNVRAVILNGSRANPDAPKDIFQDYDIVYLATSVNLDIYDPEWIRRFGEIMILQMPGTMQDPPPQSNDGFTYLMQFSDGNRIDLRLFPVARYKEIENDSLTRILLDKDNLFQSILPASDLDYRPEPPTEKKFSECCNEFWWVCPYVAKGLWRKEITYAKAMHDGIVRGQLMIMLNWYVGMKTQNSQSPGKHGKYLKQSLEPDLWKMLEKTYSDASYERSWESLFLMCDLFRLIARQVAEHFGFEYPLEDDEKVSAHLRHVHLLPGDAKEMY